MHDIFLAYAFQDRGRLAPLVYALEAQGWSVFWDHRSIKAGQDWHAVIGEAIQTCPCVIVAWSAASASSRWVREEALIALERGVIYPIMLELLDVPVVFSAIQTANFTDWNGRDDYPAFIKLKKQLSLHLGIRSHQASVHSPEQPKPEALPPQPYYEHLISHCAGATQASCKPDSLLNRIGHFFFKERVQNKEVIFHDEVEKAHAIRTLLLGPGGAGKSSLSDRLQGIPFDGKLKPATQGIEYQNHQPLNLQKTFPTSNLKGKKLNLSLGLWWPNHFPQPTPDIPA